MLKIKQCTKKGKYHGFNLQVGMYYGFDDKGCFATSLVLERHRKRNGGYYVVKVYRLDNNASYSNINNAWRECWEASDTTKAILTQANFDGRFNFLYASNMQRFPSVRTAQVHNHSNVRVYA